MIQCTRACHVLLVWANGIIMPDINSLLETWTELQSKILQFTCKITLEHSIRDIFVGVKIFRNVLSIHVMQNS